MASRKVQNGYYKVISLSPSLQKQTNAHGMSSGSVPTTQLWLVTLQRFIVQFCYCMWMVWKNLSDMSMD